MATPPQFTQVSTEQWAELPLQLVVVSEVFSPEIAQILTFDAMILMGQNAPFMSYLVGMREKTQKDAVRASGSNATYAATDGESVYIGNDYLAQVESAPNSVIQVITHEIGHATQPGGISGLKNGTVEWDNPYEYSWARARSEGVAKLAEWKVNAAFSADNKIGTGTNWQEVFSQMSAAPTDDARITVAATWTLSQEPSTDPGSTYLLANVRDYVLYRATNSYNPAHAKLISPASIEVMLPNEIDSEMWSASAIFLEDMAS